MTKRVVTDKPVQRPYSTTWPPECDQCGWRGEPNDQQSPYLACHGDPARHIRKAAA
jgi:hypothetical protein